MRRGVAALMLLLVCANSVSVVYAIRPEADQATRAQGKRLYERSCVFCHGVDGKGDGPAAWFIGRYSAPRPRDFTGENFKLRSTPTGSLPTDRDLFRTVTQGIPGYMPGFGGLTEEERWQIIDYIKSFNPAFSEETPQPITIGVPPFPPSDDVIVLGRKVYVASGCATCHGPNGKGDGEAVRQGLNKDARGLRIPVTDLTAPASFKNGSTAQDVYRSLITGLDGTPMPSTEALFANNDREAWALVYYLLSLSGGPRP